MKFSELDVLKLSLEEKYELVMNGIKDYAKDKSTQDTKVDFLIVLGARPGPIKARIIKAAELYKRGYTDYLLFSGGHGWNRNVESDSEKDQEMINYVRDTIEPQLIGQVVDERLLDIEKDLAKRADELNLDQEHKFQETPEERKIKLDEKIRRLSECQLMTKMMISLGDVPQKNIFHEPFSNNTVENIKYTKALFDSITKRGEVPSINSVMIVTSSFHCRRAMLTFKKYFKGLKILTCPSTLDLKEKGVTFSREEMLNSEYYRKQIENELNAIVNYTRNGSIEDCEISEFIDKKLAKQIAKKHSDIER